MAVKLVLNIVLCTLIVVLLRPGLDDLRGYGLDLTTGAAPADLDRSWLFFPPAVSLTTLSLATTLAGRQAPGPGPIPVAPGRPPRVLIR